MRDVVTDEAQDAEGCEANDVADHLEHRVGERVEHGRHRFRLLTDRGECDADESGEHDHCQQVPLREGGEDVLRDSVQE